MPVLLIARVEQSKEKHSFHQTLVSEIQKLLELSLYGRIHSEITAALNTELSLWHSIWQSQHQHTSAFSVLVEGERKAKVFDWSMQRRLAPPKHPGCTQLCSRKDTGLSAAAGRSQEGRLRRVGLPFRSPSPACTAIKRTKSRSEQSAIVSPSSPPRRVNFRERPVAEPRLKLLGSGFPTFVSTAFPSP